MADEGSSFDVSNLDGLAKIKAEQQSLRELAARAADHRDKVTEVYTRVVRDYEARIQSLEDQAQRLRVQAHEDFSRLDSQYAQARQALDQARFELQESEFRKEIGEFPPEEFQRRQRAIEATIAEKQRELEGITRLRGRFLELLPAEQAPQPVSPAVVPLPTPQPIVTVPPVAPPVARQVAPPVTPPIAAPPSPTPPVAAATVAPGVAAPTAPAPVAAAPEPLPTGIGETMVLPPPGAADFRVPGAFPGGDAGSTQILGGSGGRDVGSGFGTIAVPTASLMEERPAGAPVTHRLGAITTLGRTPDNQIVIPSREVSRKHAEVVLGTGGYVLRDLGSPNGTFVNGAKIKEHALQDGDRITVAGQTLVFKSR